MALDVLGGAIGQPKYNSFVFFVRVFAFGSLGASGLCRLCGVCADAENIALSGMQGYIHKLALAFANLAESTGCDRVFRMQDY